MANARIFKVDWYNGKPIVTGGGYQLAYQGDDMSNIVIFDKAPNLDNYYLVVKMKLDEADSELTTLPPIQLEGPYWVVPNYYTQIAQTITFQCCCRTPQGDYEHHSAWFTGTILPTIKHDGDPIDQSPMFDPYREWVNEIAIAAGAIVIDPTLSIRGAAADAKAVGSMNFDISVDDAGNVIAKRSDVEDLSEVSF